jgi:hypothetical protein
MNGLQTFIAIFGGKEFSNRRVYSLTYGEMRSIYFSYLRKMIVAGIILYMLLMAGLYIAVNSKNTSHAETTNTSTPSVVDIQQGYPDIGYAAGIQRKTWK